MAKKKETGIVNRIRRRLKREFYIFVFKVHGSIFQMAGIPDLVGCCAGIFIGIEVKTKKGRVSDIQEEVMREIKKKGGGHCGVATTPDEACDFVRRTLRKEGKLLEGVKAASEARSRVRLRAAGVRIAIQTTPRKNLHRRRRH